MAPRYLENAFGWLVATLIFAKREMLVITGVHKTPIEAEAGKGFDDDVLDIVKTFTAGNHQKAEEDLNALVNDITPQIFQIGVRIGTRHASIIVHEPESPRTNNCSNENPLIMSVPKVIKCSIPLSEKPRQLHIRWEDETEQKMRVFLDHKVQRYANDTSYPCPRYIEVCRVLATWKQLQFVALVSSPKEHSVVVSDCATFATNYSDRLLRLFTNEAEDVDEQMRKLDELIVIAHETGQSEGTTRREVRRKPEVWLEEE